MDGAGTDPADLEQNPLAVLSLLEADQLVASKQARFGRRPLSPWLNAALWGLRVYVLLMLATVAIQVARALRGG